MNPVKTISYTLAITGAVLLASCGSDYTGKENTHPYFKAAQENARKGQLTPAKKSYEDFLVLAPKSAVTHKELAEVCGKLNDHYAAVYHYNKYLELAKINKADENAIRNQIANAKMKAAQEYAANNRSFAASLQTQPDADTQAKFLAQRDRIRSLSENLKRAADANALLESEIKRLKEGGRSVASSGGNTNVRPGGTNVSGGNAVTPGNSNVTIVGTKTYQVMPNDNLTKIAKKEYGSATNANIDLIRNANKGKIGANDNIREGMKLVIPIKK